MKPSFVREPALTDIRDRLTAVAPGVFAALTAQSAEEHEEDATSALAALKRHRATVMMVPTWCGGQGISAAMAVKFQVGVGSLAPSTAIATTMHHYKAAALGAISTDDGDAATTVLQDLASSAKLLASGGAESTPGHDLTRLGSWALRMPEGYRVTGCKRPCSLANSMDVLSLMVELRGPDGSPEGYGQVFVPADAPNVRREPFWRSPVFHAAQSHAVYLDDVVVSHDRVLRLEGETGRRFAAACYVWFQLLISAAYIGTAFCIAEATPLARRQAGPWTMATSRLLELEAALLDAAESVDGCRSLDEQLNEAIRARDLVEDEVAGLGACLVRAAGGGTFADTGLFTALAGGLNGIAFHPPRRGAREGVGLDLLSADSRGRV